MELGAAAVQMAHSLPSKHIHKEKVVATNNQVCSAAVGACTRLTTWEEKERGTSKDAVLSQRFSRKFAALDEVFSLT